ncbi:hypothetical protein CCAX7_39030 [Capsulimonas corticalis]|uniref:Uncharacterized protein n=1 Tax=Capsulimonas corticalis TaxID=2219043 RepID=A0A402D3K6_9BACT|nr:hypothetical protein [Capsulimonas corticalis]BDI31852.1 hypothetical protein CCAX7_39030 [Capsulimonas corticalis]
MEVFLGQPISGGVAIAAAARLTIDRFGPALHPERRRRAAAAELRGFYESDPEPSQVILVMDRLYPGVVGAPMVGLEVLGIAVAEDAEPFSAPYPIVSGLGTPFLENVNEFDILVLDGDRGRVYIDADASVIARYQKPASRARVYFVDSAHLPARTAYANIRVEVLAIARSLEDVSLAMRAGADGVYLPPDNTVFGTFDEPQNSEDQTQTWKTLLDEVGALAIVLDQELERLALSPMLRACAEGQIRLITPPWLAEDVRDQFADTEIFLQDGDEPFLRPLLVAGMPITQSADDIPDDFDDFAGVAIVPTQAEDLEAAERIVLAARRSSAPVMMLCADEDFQDASLADRAAFLDAAVALGVTALTGRPDEIESIKEIIRTL